MNIKRILLPTVLIVLSFISLFIGVQDIKITDLFYLESSQIQILLLSRIPRLISIITSGISLCICGLIMQQITRNKFVSPTTAGTEDSAKLGVLISLLLMPNANSMIKMIVSFIFALGGTFLFMRILNKIKFKNTIFIPLVGIMLGNIISSIATFVAYQENLIQSVNTWMQGNFSLMIEGRYELLYITIPMCVIAYVYANKFTIAGMGEDFATNLGLSYKTVITIGISISAIVTSAVTVTVGTIPLLGLIVPNIVSIYNGDNLKKNIPDTAMIGAIFVLACDILGRTLIFPYEISIGLMVSIIGSVLFLFLLFRKKVTY